MEPEVHNLVFAALKGGHRGSTKAAQSQSEKNTWMKVNRRIRQWPEMCIKTMYNPVAGCEEERLVIPGDNGTYRILVHQEEIDMILSKYYFETKGDGALKLEKRLEKLFVGLNRKLIQKWLNQRQSVQQNKPLFTNVAPLIPVQAKTVMERNQIDLVDLRSLADYCHEIKYKYVLAVMDIFSRYLWLRPLQSKTADEVAEHLEAIYQRVGPPRLIQSDQGPEFKGAVRKLMAKLNVKVIMSAPYKPQSQGKLERSHSTWKSKLRLILEEFCKEDESFVWADSLENVERLYNEGHHSSIGMSPFEVFYGRKSNREVNMMRVGQDSAPEDMEVEMEYLPEGQMFEDDVLFAVGNEEDIRRHMEERQDIRSKAKKKANKASSYMVKRNVRKNPPSSYEVGEKIFLRVRDKKSGVIRGGKPLHKPLVYYAEIIDVNRETFRYKVKYVDDGNEFIDYVSVNHITSLTRAQEQDKQRQARGQSTKKLACMCKDEKCKRKPALDCRFKMNAACCEKQGKKCRHHGVGYSTEKLSTSEQPTTVKQPFMSEQPSTSWQASTSGDPSTCIYNLSSPEVIGRIFGDFSRDLRLMTLKLSPENNERNLDMNIQNAGLEYEEPRTPGDGNCLFHALAAQLQRTTSIRITHNQLRAQVVDHLHRNRNTPDGTHMQAWILNGDWDGYLSEMARDGVWGDEIILVSVANIFNVEITVISSLPGTSIRILSPSRTDVRELPMILLGHLSEAHYSSLVPRENNTVDPELSSLVDKVQGMSKDEIKEEMELPSEDQYVEGESLDSNCIMLGMSDITRFWAAHVAERGSMIPIHNNHFVVTDEEIGSFLHFRDDNNHFEVENNVCVIYIDIVLILWLVTTGKLNLLRKSKIVHGSFLYLCSDDAERYREFRDILIAEKQLELSKV